MTAFLTATTDAEAADATEDSDATASPGARDGDLAAAAAATATPADALALDVAFDVLKNSRRRQVLHLVMAGGSTTISDVSEQIAALENDKPRDQLDAQERKRVYVGLYQCHLPRMDDVGIVAFDEDRGTVEAGPHAAELYRYLETATEEEADEDAPAGSWPLGAAIGGVGGALVTAAVATALPAALPAVVGGALVVAGAAIAYQLLESDR